MYTLAQLTQKNGLLLIKKRILMTLIKTFPNKETPKKPPEPHHFTRKFSQKTQGVNKQS